MNLLKLLKPFRQLIPNQKSQRFFSKIIQKWKFQFKNGGFLTQMTVFHKNLDKDVHQNRPYLNEILRKMSVLHHIWSILNTNNQKKNIPCDFFFFFCCFFLNLIIITIITTINNKNPAPPQASAIISSVFKAPMIDIKSPLAPFTPDDPPADPGDPSPAPGSSFGIKTP